MKLSKYDPLDLIAVKNGEVAIEDIARKYNTTEIAIAHAMRKRGLYLCKKRVRVTRKWKRVTEITEYENVYQCSLALGVDSATIKKAIEGDCKKLSKYKIEYIEKEEYIDEQTGERYAIDNRQYESHSESLNSRGKEKAEQFSKP